MPEFYIIIARKKCFSPNFKGSRDPLPPVSYAYGKVKKLDHTPVAKDAG